MEAEPQDEQAVLTAESTMSGEGTERFKDEEELKQAKQDDPMELERADKAALSTMLKQKLQIEVSGSEGSSAPVVKTSPLPSSKMNVGVPSYTHIVSSC